MSNSTKSHWQPLSFRDISPHKNKTASEDHLHNKQIADEKLSNFTGNDDLSVREAQYEDNDHSRFVDVEDNKHHDVHEANSSPDENHEQDQKEYTRGYEIGHAEGHQQGYELGQTEGIDKIRQQLEQQIERERMIAVQSILDLVSNFQKSINDIDEAIVPKLAHLSMIAAQKLVGSLPETVYQQLTITIRELISQFPILGKNIQLYVNPNDIGIMQDSLSNELAKYDWHLIPDPSIEAGGCKVISEQNEIDATVSSKLQVMTDIINKGNSKSELL